MINILIFVFLGTLGWGGSLYLIKLLLANISPTEIVLYRALIASVALFILAKALRLKCSSIKSLCFDGLIVGLFNMALPFYLTTIAEESVSTALASVINGLTPLATFLLGYSLFKNRQDMNFFNLLSIVLGFVGMILVNVDAVSSAANVPYILALVAACFSYGIAANYVKSYAKTREPILVSAMSSAVTCVAMLALKWGQGNLAHWGLPVSALQWSVLLWLGVVGTGVSLYLYCVLIKRAGAFTASMITYLMTVTGVILGMSLLGESFSDMAIAGCVFIVISLLFVNHANLLQQWFRKSSVFPVKAY